MNPHFWTTDRRDARADQYQGGQDTIATPRALVDCCVRYLPDGHKGCQISNEVAFCRELKMYFCVTSTYAWKESLGAFVEISSLKRCHLINL